MTELKCDDGCCSIEVSNVNDSVVFVDAIRYLWANCPKKDTYLHGEKKNKEE